ncbi:hypothetical protein HNY73_011609, partial [Argiope bruennichi]
HVRRILRPLHNGSNLTQQLCNHTPDGRLPRSTPSPHDGSLRAGLGYLPWRAHLHLPFSLRLPAAHAVLFSLSLHSSTSPTHTPGQPELRRPSVLSSSLSPLTLTQSSTHPFFPPSPLPLLPQPSTHHHPLPPQLSLPTLPHSPSHLTDTTAPAKRRRIRVTTRRTISLREASLAVTDNGRPPRPSHLRTPPAGGIRLSRPANAGQLATPWPTVLVPMSQ